MAEPRLAASSGAQGVQFNLNRTPSARSRFEAGVKVALMAAAALSVLTTLLIIGSLLFESIEFFGEVPIGDFIFGTKWTPQFAGAQQSFGVVPLVWGTIYLSLIALAVAVPLGLLSAVYLSEYAPPRVRKTVKPVLELLAGVPTIVFGYFALTFFSPEILNNLLGIQVGVFNGLGAGLIMGLLVLPTIASVAEDAMAAVPYSLREGAFGLGASKLQVSLRIVFPAALSGIVAALVLGASRAIGETVLVLIAGGQTANLGVDPRESFQTMAAYIAAQARGDIPAGSVEYLTIFAVGFTLFLITLGAQHHLDPARPEVPAGVRMTGAQIAAAARAQNTVIPRRSNGDAVRSGGFVLLMYTAVGVAFLGLGLIIWDFASDGVPVLSMDFLTSFPSRVIPTSSGIQSAIVGTIYLMIICAVLVIPLGVMTAIYLEEYADGNRWFNRFIEVNIQNLAGVPSVVYGILGLAFIVRGPLSMGPVLLAGGITLALLVLPVVIIVAREAIRAVPPSIREGSLALGATQWQTIWKQVLPGSIAGIATGVILALSRAIGETAPLLVVGAGVSLRFNPESLDSAFTALPIQIFAWTQDPNQEFVARAAGAICVLMIILLAMNSVAIWLRNRYEQKW